MALRHRRARSTFAKANRQIIELMDNPLLRIKMGRAGRKRVEEELQWSVVGGNLLAAYRSVLGHRGRP